MSAIWSKVARWFQDRTPGIEWGDYAVALVIAPLIASLFVGFAYWQDRWDRLPAELIHVAAWLGLIIWPAYIMSRHKRRQDRLLDRIRAVFVLSTGHLMEGQQRSARNGLARIRRMERLWRFGASYPYRLALLSSVMATNVMIALVYVVTSHHISPTFNNQNRSLPETLRVIWETPFLLHITIGFALLLAVTYAAKSFAITSRQWAEFYGDRLDAALRAGRGVDAAPQHEGAELPREGVTARELLGLNPGFSKAELRRAWLRLARELHPDRWAGSGAGVRLMKEAALKRVNAARDELAPQAS
jgi:hypothetical protein